MARLMRFGIKAGLVAGTVYFTIDQGFWKRSEETTLLYGKIYQKVTPLVKSVSKEVDIEIPDIPKVEDVWYLVQNGYNKGIIASTRFLCSLPNKIVGWSKTGMEMAMKQINQAPGDDSNTLKKVDKQ